MFVENKLWEGGRAHICWQVFQWWDCYM